MALLAATGWIHLHLWQGGYGEIPTVDDLFIANYVSSFLLALGMLVWPCRLVAVSGLGLALGTIGGLAISVEVGLFGFTDSLSAPYAVESLFLESLAVLVLATWLTVDLRATRSTSRFKSDG